MRKGKPEKGSMTKAKVGVSKRKQWPATWRPAEKTVTAKQFRGLRRREEECCGEWEIRVTTERRF